MRVTIVNPPWQFSNPNKIFPMGVSYLGAFLRKEGRSEVAVLDLNILVQDPRNVIRRSIALVEETQPEILGLSCWTVHVPFVVEFVRRYKARHKSVFVVLGGNHASAAAQELMNLCPADAVVHGEGEETLAELVAALEQGVAAPGPSLGQIRGITFRQGGELITTEPRPRIRNLDQLPLPAYDLLPPARLYQPWNRRYVMPVTASRGCVFHCTFCSQRQMWRHQRWRSPESVVAEVRWLTSTYDAGFIRFEDDDLLVNPNWAIRLLEQLRGVTPPFSCLARLDSMRDGMVERLATAGCTEVYHGFESASPRIRRLLRKELPDWVDLNWTRELVARELAHGIVPTISGMIGIPTETAAEMESTVEYLSVLRAMGARTQIWILTPYPGTEITEKYRDHLVPVDRWRRFGQFDVFSEVARDAYGKLIDRYSLMVGDRWMFRSEAGIDTVGRLYQQAKARLMGVFDFV